MAVRRNALERLDWLIAEDTMQTFFDWVPRTLHNDAYIGSRQIIQFVWRTLVESHSAAEFSETMVSRNLMPLDWLPRVHATWAARPEGCVGLDYAALPLLLTNVKRVTTIETLLYNNPFSDDQGPYSFVGWKSLELLTGQYESNGLRDPNLPTTRAVVGGFNPYLPLDDFAATVDDNLYGPESTFQAWLLYAYAQANEAQRYIYHYGAVPLFDTVKREVCLVVSAYDLGTPMNPIQHYRLAQMVRRMHDYTKARRPIFEALVRNCARGRGDDTCDEFQLDLRYAFGRLPWEQPLRTQ